MPDEITFGVNCRSWISDNQCFGAQEALGKRNLDDFGLGADPQRRAPTSGPAGGVELRFTNAAQAIGELTVDSLGNPGEWEKLTEVRVTSELESDTRFLRNGGLVRCVCEQNACAR